MASQFGAYFEYAYKNIGLSVGISDHALSYAASSAGLLQLVSRIGFGTLYDKLGFKKIFIFIMILNGLNGLFVYRLRHIEWIFIIGIELTYFIFAGTYAVYPTAIYKTFG